MKRRLAALLAALMLLSGCSAAPKEKTIVLSESAAPAEEETETAQMSFEVSKIHRLSPEKLDPSGIHPALSSAVAQWIDEDNLMAMTVQLEESAESDGEAEGEEISQKIVTQFVRIQYQYGFFDPALTLEETEAECFDVSSDGRYAALVAGNSLQVYSLDSGRRVRESERDVLASRVVFADSGDSLYFTAAGAQKRLERLSVSDGTEETVLEGKSYRALAAGEKGVVYYVQERSGQSVGYTDFTNNAEELLTGGTVGSVRLLSSGGALAVYDGRLYLLDSSGAQEVEEGVTAFDLGSDGMHIAYAVRNEDGTTDIRVGYWGGSRIINDKLTYKDLGLEVDRIFFSPEMKKLYLQGTDETGSLGAYTFVFQ